MNISFPILARYFGSSARLLLLPIPDACCCTLRIRQGQVTKQLTKIAAKNKTKPFQSHSKPFFPKSNFDFSLKTRIFDKFRTTFLCKTKPIYKNLILSMSFQKTLNMRNKANLFLPSTKKFGAVKTNPMVCLLERVILFKNNKKYQTKPILTFS